MFPRRHPNTARPNPYGMNPLSIAMIGTRGVPARYGGFETAVEEVGQRLTARGHRVTVYCRGADDLASYLGMDLVHLPAVRRKALETLSHTGISLLDMVRSGYRPDAAIVFNAANSPVLPALRARNVPVATHVDGLEWKRSKWGGTGRRYYRTAESLAVRWSDALIADAQGIADYYAEEFRAPTELISYGAPIIESCDPDLIAPLGLAPGGFHLVVARFEPENHVREIVEGYAASSAALPLVVVGSSPYSNDYTERIAEVAAKDRRITLLGGLWDQAQLDALYAGAATYLHGHSVGGTNPSLLRAMGAGAFTIAFDVNFNRDVLGEAAWFFDDPAGVARHIEAAEADDVTQKLGMSLRDRARERYDWNEVADSYEALLRRLASGWSARGTASGRRYR